MTSSMFRFVCEKERGCSEAFHAGPKNASALLSTVGSLNKTKHKLLPETYFTLPA